MIHPLPTLALALLLGAGTAMAATQTSTTAPAVSCDRTGVDRAACQQEKRAAAREMQRKGGLATPTAEAAQRNLRARCDPLPAEDRQACLRRMDGEGKQTGSVDGGGVLRELVVTEPPAGDPPAVAAERPKP